MAHPSSPSSMVKNRGAPEGTILAHWGLHVRTLGPLAEPRRLRAASEMGGHEHGHHSSRNPSSEKAVRNTITVKVRLAQTGLYLEIQY